MTATKKACTTKAKAKTPKPTLATINLKNASGRGKVDETATKAKTATPKKADAKEKKLTKKETTKVLVVRANLDAVKKLQSIMKKDGLTMDGILNHIIANYLKRQK